jgi:hypothetical protein
MPLLKSPEIGDWDCKVMRPDGSRLSREAHSSYVRPTICNLSGGAFRSRSKLSMIPAHIRIRLFRAPKCSRSNEYMPEKSDPTSYKRFFNRDQSAH